MKTIGRDFQIRISLICSLAIFGALGPNALNAQSANLSKIEMKKISNWVGNWEGEGWSMNESRQREEFKIKEQIQSKLGGMALFIEGFGTSKVDNKPVHTAMAMLYFNKDKGVYEMKSLVERGMTTLAEANFDAQGNFVWGFSVEGGSIKYSISLTPDTWVEKGFFVTGGGQEYPMMEMTLKKVK